MTDAPELPEFSAIIVDVAKLRDYCLSASHPRGRHKARVFRSSLGLVASQAETLRAALLTAARNQSQNLRRTENDAYGQRYLLDFEMTTLAGTAIIRSRWIAPLGLHVLRFVTCYIR